MNLRVLCSRKKKISSFLLIVFLSNYIVPISLLANDPQAGTGDYYGYGYSGNNGYSVSESTGSLNYEVPITSIPEYPLSVTYSSGATPFVTPGAFGYGFSSFS